jgi:hypothetical protein
MGKINWGRVIAGGLLAGLVLNVFDFVIHGVVLADQWNAAMAALGKGEMSGSATVWYVVFDFLLGIATVWLYAAIRPRYGPGPQTAACAGLFVWFIVGFLFNLAQIPSGLYPGNLLLISAVASLVSVPLATVAGAWAYKEEAAV